MTQAAIQLIVGLGNPGAQYAGTRHNVGFWWVDALAAAQGAVFRPESRFFGELTQVLIADQEIRLLKPTTYMNRSGQSVAAVARYFAIPTEQILIAHDELDLPVGTVRLKRGGGHAGHNGLRDTIATLGSPEFLRLRIGIAHPGDKTLVTCYVLGRPSREDESRIRGALDDATALLPELIAGRIDLAMNRLHGSR
ncbi:aminoacyl-tRNA hydrolase [Caldichromatium japonicum]|uniref:Peptidyl-tRNA hydrolase n=1 Tax=Caldichromatium japonicum TaxID=2699430 RepID=A0A6G7VBG1_9GAMM|nr:aminoacyl-tRNA hydrolase [Caldichromatium japonicum]QIK37188.1 aminoacyl-tRNA hydrolase [Caldichromatium japonicum]